MKKIIIIIFLYSLNTISCQEKKENKEQLKTYEDKNNIIKMDTLKFDEAKIKKYYENINLLKEDEDYYLSENDIVMSIPILKKGLSINGFKFITESEFNNRIKKIFKIVLSESCFKILDHKYFFTYSMQDCKSFTSLNDCIENNISMEYLYDNNIFFIKNYNFITPLPIPWKIAKLENNKLQINLPHSIISRNKYLFNDDKSQFSWLINNDKDFMESLITIFGYTEDEKLLNWVMDKNYNQAEDFVKNYVFVRNCQNKLEIREDILKYIEASTNDKEYQYAKQLLNLSDRNDWKNFSDEEYFKILAYMANTFDPLSEKYSEVGMETHAKWSILGKEYYERKPEQWNQLIKEFKKNNYYGLPNLKHALKQAESYGDISIEVAQ